MQISDQDFQLEQKRTDAKITQAEMASYLGVSQSQVSRYEQDPENVPAGVMKRWLQYCGDISGVIGLEMTDPRIELNERVKLMESYATVEPDHGDVEPPPSPTATQFLASVHTTAKKPRVGVAGRFDSGKSRLINVLLGGNRLPTAYQPATSVTCLIRHMKDKPAWQAEDVLIMGKGFNLDMADDEQHCLGSAKVKGHKMFAGGYESLCQYGTHTGTGREHKAFAAVVYIDSPFLTGADLVDLPGYGHSEDDKDRAEMAHKLVDVVIYASQATGFLDQLDLAYLNVLLANLPAPETPNGIKTPLLNLFVVATHAHQVTKGECDGILDRAAKRAFMHLDNAMDTRARQTDVGITEEHFRKRFFTFSADDSSLRNIFENDIKDLLTKTYPSLTLSHLDNHVRLAKEEAVRTCDTWITRLKAALGEREKAQNEVTAIKAEEPNRLRKKNAHQQKINSLIDHYANESTVFVNKAFSDRASITAIESLIKARYNNKKEAHQLAAHYLVDTIQKAVNDWIKTKANELGAEIENFLDGYGPAIDKQTLAASGWDFNARVAFMSALSGLGAIGALAAWAAIAAAGSNLGGYILIAQIVGWLSSIGISVGGTATVISIVSSIGGPITLAIVAAFAVFIGALALFGDSWQTKLAKKIHEGLLKENAEKKFQDGIANYWGDTKKAFAVAVEKTEAAYQEKLKSMETLAFSSNKADIERELKVAEENRSFFAGMPWKPMPN